MGEIVRLTEARARKPRTRGAERVEAEAPPPRPRGFEAADFGSGWYHGDAIRASPKPNVEPH